MFFHLLRSIARVTRHCWPTMDVASPVLLLLQVTPTGPRYGQIYFFPALETANRGTSDEMLSSKEATTLLAEE